MINSKTYYRLQNTFYSQAASQKLCQHILQELTVKLLLPESLEDVYLIPHTQE